MRDLTGETFGSLTVIGKAEDLNGRSRWKCKCNKCGNVLDVLELGLLYRSPKCTCESKKALKDLTGKTIGQFYVIEKAESRRDSTGHLRGYWKCRCNKCGTVSEIPAKNLNANKHLICRNCSNSTMPLGAAKPKLRMIYDRLNSYNSLCNEWRNSYPAFEKWAYDNGYDLEDKDNTFFVRPDMGQPYSPTNCIIEDRNNNPKIIISITDKDGSKLSVTDLQNKYNISPVFTYRAKHQGYSDDQILSGQFVNAPYKIGNLEYKNAHGSMSDFYNALKIDREVFTKYVRDNMFDMDRAFEMMKKDNISVPSIIFINDDGRIISEEDGVKRYLSKTKYDDFVGKKFGHLTIIEDAGYKESGSNRYKMWKCQCDCGNITYVPNGALISGHTKSCGAPIHKETHGESKNRLYKVWSSMKDRCYNPNASRYESYGGKGIKICDEWKDNYEAFRDWALANGYDSNADKFECTIDRIDNNGNYCPENCRFIDMKGQGNNKSTNIHFDYNGERLTGSRLAEKLGVRPKLIYDRRRCGWSNDDIINRPIKDAPKVYNLLNGDSGICTELCKKYKIKRQTVEDRIENGWDITNAFLMPPKTRELFDVDGHPGLKNAICFMDNDYNKISQQEYCRRNSIPLEVPAVYGNNEINKPSFKRLIKK